MLLLEQGANPNAEGAYYETPLFSAANHEVAEVLLQYGANTEASNIAGETPLLSEAAFGGGDRALIEDPPEIWCGCQHTFKRRLQRSPLSGRMGTGPSDS